MVTTIYAKRQTVADWHIISSWKVNKGFFSHDLRVNLRRR